jgi:hypothetical protein
MSYTLATVFNVLTGEAEITLAVICLFLDGVFLLSTGMFLDLSIPTYRDLLKKLPTP